jgi:hypothetical protein
MFDYNFWGNVAAWASAIGTGGAAIVAAGYYVLSARSRKRNQARQVHAEVTFAERGKIHPFNFVLYNDSEHPISGFYVGRYKERRLIPSVFNNPVPFQKMRDDGEVEQTSIAMLLLNPKRELVGFDGRENDMRLRIETPTTTSPANGPTNATKAESTRVLPTGESVVVLRPEPGQRGMRVRTEAASRVLPAGESVALKPGPNHRFRWSTVYWIGFLDANGNRWEREVTNNIMTYGRLRKGKQRYFEIRAKRRRRRLKYSWDVTRWVWRNRRLQTHSQREPSDNVEAPSTVPGGLQT